MKNLLNRIKEAIRDMNEVDRRVNEIKDSYIYYAKYMI